MRIVSFDEFSKLPIGTVFAHIDGQPEYPELTLEGLYRTEGSIEKGGLGQEGVVRVLPLSFPVLESRSAVDSRDVFYGYQDAVRENTPPVASYQTHTLHEVWEGQSFLIYEKTDLEAMIGLLQQALQVAQQPPATVPESNVTPFEITIDSYVRLCVRARVWNVEEVPAKRQQFTDKLVALIKEGVHRGEELTDFSAGIDEPVKLPKSALRKMHQWFDELGVDPCLDWASRNQNNPESWKDR